ncbi:MAG: hypothetical protein IPJ02_17440 [Chitinophagaceae bacterium]|nr:hypothetical protein [Chitinophagaceae bacterium]
MKKILFVVISLLYGVAYGQVCADEDTVRSNAVSLITANTVRVNGTVAHFSGAPTSLQLRYVRVGQTDTATSSSVPSTALRNLTGLQAATQYYYYYKTICGSGSVSQTIGAYTFTTLANTVLYAPERPTVFNHLKVDSSFIVPEGDTVVGREPSTRAQIRYKTSDNTFYGYYTDCTCWRALAIDSSGIIGLLDGKVDSVTVSGDSLFYWKVGVSYGYILPSVATVWHTTGNTGIDTSTDFIGTTDNVDFPIKTNDVRRFTVNTSGALGIGASPDYGTSGYVLKSAGSAAAPTWTTHTFQNAITAGSTLTAGNVINGGGFDFEFGTMGNFTVESTNGSIEFTDLLQNSIDLSGSIGINIKPYTGLLIIDTLINNTAQNQLIGWTSTAGADRGEVGYITIGSGLSLSSGALSATGGSLTATYLGYGSGSNTLTGDANLTYTAASSAVALDSGYLSFTGHKNYGSAVNGSIFRSSLYGLTTRAVAGSSYDWLLFSAGGNTILANPTGTDNFLTSGKFGFGSLGLTPTAWAHVAASTTGVASIRIGDGVAPSSPNAGDIWKVTDKLYFVINTGTATKEITLNDIPLTSGRVPYNTPNGRLTDVSTFTFGSGLLSVPQIKGSGSTPAIAGGAGAGTSPTVSITGTDLAGEITVTTDTDPTTGAVFCTVTFATAFSSAPYVVFSPSNLNAADLFASSGDFFINSTTTTFTLNTSSGVPPANATEYKFHYHVIQ